MTSLLSVMAGFDPATQGRDRKHLSEWPWVAGSKAGHDDCFRVRVQ